MAIKLRNKRSTDFSTASMSDLVFLLLIFFMLTSTLVSPSAVKLLLPQSNARTIDNKPKKVTIYIDEKLIYYIDNDTPISEDQILPLLAQKLQGETEASVILRVDFSVPVQQIVVVIDAVNQINDSDPTQETKHKVILATQQKK